MLTDSLNFNIPSTHKNIELNFNVLNAILCDLKQTKNQLDICMGDGDIGI